MITSLRSEHYLQHHRSATAQRVVVPEPAPRSHRIGCDPLFSFDGRPGGVTVDADQNIYLSEVGSATIWRISLDGTSQPVAGPGSGPDRLHSPEGMAIAPDGSLVVVDATAHRICSVGTDGSIRVLAGGTSGYRDGPAAQAAFRFPSSVAVGPDGSIFVADTGNDRIRQVSPDGQVRTVAGSAYDYGDGRGEHARFRRPVGLAMDSSGTVYIADTGNNAIRRMSPDGQVTTVAGGPPGGDRDGARRVTGLRWPAAIAVGADGCLWIPDFGNGKVRVIDPTGETSTVLEIPGMGWPAAIAPLPGGGAVVAGSTLDDHLDRHGCLMVIGDGHRP